MRDRSGGRVDSYQEPLECHPIALGEYDENDLKPMILKDIAEIKETYDESSILQYVNGNPAVEISVRRSKTSDALDTAAIVEEELIKFMIVELSGILVCIFKDSRISDVKFGKLGITLKLSLKEIKSLGFDTSVITLLINLSISDTFFKQSDIWVRSI